MNTNFVAMLVLVLTLCFAAVSGQLSEPSEYEQPVDRQWDTGRCHEKMVAALYEATDITDPAQDKHLKAAEAYRLLDLSGQDCS
jgi:hypothetical protein